MGTFNLIRSASDRVNYEADMEVLGEELTSVSRDKDGDIVNEALLDAMKNMLGQIKQKALDPVEGAAVLSGLRVLTQPEAADVMTADVLKRAGVTANVNDPKALELLDQNKSVRDSVAKIGHNYASQTAPKYEQMLKQAMETGQTQAVAGVMKEILTAAKQRAARATIGIKKKVAG